MCEGKFEHCLTVFDSRPKQEFRAMSALDVPVNFLPGPASDVDLMQEYAIRFIQNVMRLIRSDNSSSSLSDIEEG